MPVLPYDRVGRVVWDPAPASRAKEESMHLRNIDKALCLNILGAFILLAGFAAAGWIYAGAGGAGAGRPLGYEEGGGRTYPVNPEDSRQYQRQLELYGGKGNILADKLNRWLAGLWQGKSLAVMVAGAALAVALGLFVAAGRVQGGRRPGVHKGNRGAGV
jgi:hypothetical protein